VINKAINTLFKTLIFVALLCILRVSFGNSKYQDDVILIETNENGEAIFSYESRLKEVKEIKAFRLDNYGKAYIESTLNGYTVRVFNKPLKTKIKIIIHENN